MTKPTKKAILQFSTLLFALFIVELLFTDEWTPKAFVKPIVNALVLFFVSNCIKSKVQTIEQD